LLIWIAQNSLAFKPFMDLFSSISVVIVGQQNQLLQSKQFSFTPPLSLSPLFWDFQSHVRRTQHRGTRCGA